MALSKKTKRKTIKGGSNQSNQRSIVRLNKDEKPINNSSRNRPSVRFGQEPHSAQARIRPTRQGTPPRTRRQLPPLRIQPSQEGQSTGSVRPGTPGPGRPGPGRPRRRQLPPIGGSYLKKTKKNRRQNKY